MKRKIIIFQFLLIGVIGQAQALKLMTYNIRLDVETDQENDWTHRKDYFASQIHFYEPDILGVQEAKPNQINDMATFFADFRFVGTGRDGANQGESSAIFYKTARLLLLESNTFWLSETPASASKGWDAAFNRVCTYALFDDKKTKQKFWVFNTHLDHVGEEAKTKGIALILSKIAALNSRKYPVFFMGDFNSEPTTDRIIELKKVMNDARDITQEKPFGPTGTFNNFKHNEATTKLIDYIFISKNDKVQVRKYAVLSDSKDLRYPSDHLPVYIEINFKTKNND